jgi:membrane associated rhomboid family serine protease
MANSGRRRSVFSYIPGYTNNAVLQVIIFSGVTYMMLAISWAIIELVYSGSASNFDTYFIPNLALPNLAGSHLKWWTLLTYGWFQYLGFFALLSNMLWLYCFGSVVQMLVGHRQIIGLYAYSLIIGGVFYLIAQYLPGAWGEVPSYMLGPRAGLMGMAAAAVTITPKYRFYLSETLSIPLIAVAGVFAALMILESGYYMPVILMLAGGALAGFGYIKVLQAGYRPGEWMYSLSARMEALVTPNERKISKKRKNDVFHNPFRSQHEHPQSRVDEILDKINQKGYNSLSNEEKDILNRAGKN